MSKFRVALSLLVVLGAAVPARSGALGEGLMAYLPASVDGVAVQTCVVEVGGKGDCGPDTLGAAALDSARLGFTMLTISGLTGSEDKRWDQVVYGVTDKLCSEGGASMGVMHLTEPGLFKDNLKELDGMIGAGKVPLVVTAIGGVDFYVGYLQSRDCIMAFGYPDDKLIMLAFAGKDERDKVTQMVKEMLGAAKDKN